MLDEFLSALEKADAEDYIGFTRHLCELYLRDHPDHGPTLLRYASQLISLSQYSAAREALDRAEAVLPQKRLNWVFLRRGWLLKAEGDFTGAEAMFLRAHELDPVDATHLIYAGMAAFDRGDIDRAIVFARRAVACSEGCIDEAWFNLGGYLLSKKEFHEAMECYRRALAIDPDYKLAKERLADVQKILEHQRDYIMREISAELHAQKPEESR
ncbi:MAG TPA: tetratricopeptide repeat protein [Chthoniobacter sp.]|jgi:tetratricopeptide (TPR) repeat protein